MGEKIGLGIITCNREHFFRKCIESIPQVDELVIVNDGKPYPEYCYPCMVDEVIQHSRNKGVGKSKNEALKYLYEKGCKHLFLCEDDVAVQSQDVFQRYIETSYESGLWHLNFAYHGPANKNELGAPAPVATVEITDKISIGLHPYLCGAFSYYRKEVIETVGLIDERFKNAYEHVDHTYQIILAGYNPPFFWFPDIRDSYTLIRDLDPDLSGSVIRKVGERKYRLMVRYYGWKFRRKNGISVDQIPCCSENEAIRSMFEIKNKYSKI